MQYFNNEADSTEFLNRLNSQHKNLQFTMEKSTNTLPFLDMELKIHNNNLQSWIWRKPTTKINEMFNFACYNFYF